jgi:hypothetical protein
MKIWFTILLYLYCASSYGQTSDRISQIRSIVAKINSDSAAYKTKTLDNDEFIDGTDNGSSLTGYYKNGELVKIAVWVGLSHWIVTEEYYLDNSNLIFVYKKERTIPYRVPGDSFDFMHPEITMENRCYFKDKKLIKVISKGTSNDPSFKNDAEEMLADLKKYSELLKKRK